jgi:putative thiamine transport system ATP-binding protein
MSLELHGTAIRHLTEDLIRPFSVEVAAGEIVTLMGPSGSGKSSLLAYLAGDLPKPLEGRGVVMLNGQDVLKLRPEARRIGRLFQDDMLFPHLTVLQNVLFGMPRGSCTSRVEKARSALSLAGLAGFEDRLPQTLSGGQRARVALLRALAAEPQALLLDEPFAKLDAELRENIRSYVFASIADAGIPAILVTHDIADAPEDGRIFRISAKGEVERA